MSSFRALQGHHTSAAYNSASRIPRVTIPNPPLPWTSVRRASGAGSINREKQRLAKLKSKRKQRSTFRRDDMKKAITFSLCDAVRYLKAFEVGRNIESTKYEVHVSFKSLKSAPVARGQIRMPHTVDTSQRIAVICPPDSDAAKDAISRGASAVGEDDLIAQIKHGNIEFERLLLHPDSQEKFKKANLGRTLGPKGLMPNTKTGTIVRDIGAAIRNMIGGSAYREKQGVVRVAIGQLGFTPDMLSKNIKVLMDKLKDDLFRINQTVYKEIHEVVLSSTNGPGFPLNGSFASERSLNSAQLSVN